MPKRTIIFFCVLFLIVLFVILNSPFKQAKKDIPHPPPTTILNKEAGNEQEDYEQWYESIHHAAPGVNWRAIDRETRYQKYVAHLKHHFSRHGFSDFDTLANGNIIGNWHERGSVNQAGRIWAADIDTSTGYIYCVSDGGNVWKGTITGQNWTVLNDNLRFSAHTMLRVIPNGSGHRIIVAGGQEVYYSDNDGSTWIASNGLDTLQKGGNGIKQALVADDSLHTIYFIADERDWVHSYEVISLYKSTDKGTSFTRIIKYPHPVNGTNYFDIWISRYGVYDPILMHDDSIFSINLINDSLSFISTINLSSEGNTFLTGCRTNTANYLYAYVDTNLYQSVNGGMNWSLVGHAGKSLFGNNPNAFSCSLNNPLLIYMGKVEASYSVNGGISWDTTNNWGDYYNSPSTKLHADIPCIIPLLGKTGNEFDLIGTDGGLFVSYTNMVSVQNISLQGLDVSEYYSVYTDNEDPNYIYAAAQDQGFQRCQQDSGTILGFEQLISGDYNHIVSSDSGKSLWVSYPSFTMYYANATTDHNAAAWWNFNSTTHYWFPPMVADPKLNNIAYIAGGVINDTGSYIVKLTENGGNINSTQLPFDFYSASGKGNISALAISPINTNYWYVLTSNGNFFWSADAGATWTKNSNLDGLGANYLYGATIYPSHTILGVVYIGGSGYSNPPAFESSDHGQSFTAITNGLPSTMVVQLMGNENDSLIYAATDVGPYVFVVAEQKWYDIQGSGAPDQQYSSVNYIASTKTVRFATYGRGIWDLGPLIQSANNSNYTNNVTIFPNPATANCIMSVVCNQTGNASLSIYSITGQQLLTEPIILNTGNNTIPVATYSYPAGVYLVRISFGDQLFVKKLLKL